MLLADTDTFIEALAHSQPVLASTMVAVQIDDMIAIEAWMKVLADELVSRMQADQAAHNRRARCAPQAGAARPGQQAAALTPKTGCGATHVLLLGFADRLVVPTGALQVICWRLPHRAHMTCIHPCVVTGVSQRGKR